MGILYNLKKEERELRKKSKKVYNNMKQRVLRNKTYSHITICKEWDDFEVFHEWYKNNFVEGWQLDKDLLGGNEYSPTNCIFVPCEVNQLFRSLPKNNTLGYRGIQLNGGKYSLLSKIGGVYNFGKQRVEPEMAYADYLMFRASHIDKLSKKYSQLHSVLQVKVQECIDEAKKIYEKYQ